MPPCWSSTPTRESATQAMPCCGASCRTTVRAWMSGCSARARPARPALGDNQLEQMRNGEMTTVAVIGLGYVGLPLVVEFGKQIRTIGFDISTAKVESCRRGVDPSRELSDEQVQAAKHAI